MLPLPIATTTTTSGGIANAVSSSPETSAEAIRLLSSKVIPGLGPLDVYYASYFAGRWKVTRVISDTDDEYWLDMKREYGTDLLPLIVEHEMRFDVHDYRKDFIAHNNGDA